MRRWSNSLVGAKDEAAQAPAERKQSSHSWEALKGTLSVLMPAMTPSRKRA